MDLNLPEALKAEIVARLGVKIVKTEPVGGGDISRSLQIDLTDGQRVLVKWHPAAIPGLFTAEQRGLDLLRTAGAARVPQVLAHGETEDDCPAFIVLEWLETGPKTARSAEALGAGLATLHRVTGSSFGLDHDNFIGANPQPNHPGDDWGVFFCEQRLVFQMELAGQNGLMPRQRARWLDHLLARLGDWLPAHPPASLVHGDLWGGNWLATATGEPVLIDPAVYYGHREVDLAFTELFGGFPTAFYAAYNEAWSLDLDYSERKDIYNLYHLLNHLNLFGESYGSRVDSILRRYGG